MSLELINCSAGTVVPKLLPPVPEDSRLTVFALDLKLDAGAKARLSGIAPDEVREVSKTGLIETECFFFTVSIRSFFGPEQC